MNVSFETTLVCMYVVPRPKEEKGLANIGTHTLPIPCYSKGLGQIMIGGGASWLGNCEN